MTWSRPRKRRFCVECGVEHPNDGSYGRIGGQGGRVICASCRGPREVRLRKLRYLRNYEKFKQFRASPAYKLYRQQYYQNNKAKFDEMHKIRYAFKRRQIRERAAAYYQENKTDIAAKTKHQSRLYSVAAYILRELGIPTNTEDAAALNALEQLGVSRKELQCLAEQVLISA